jgi:hypothetical protein
MPADSGCLSRKTLNNPHIMMHATPLRRFTKADPCPICGGHDTLGRGRGVRCFGYYLGNSARCTREEWAGELPQNRDCTYSHRLHGRCRCGQRHGEGPSSAGAARPFAPSTLRRRVEQRFRSFFTLTAYLKRRYGEGTAVCHWAYADAAGKEAFRVLRVDYRAPDGARAKSYRPCHRCTNGKWLLSRPKGKLPIYNLPAILAAPPETVVAILEGEKCADIAAALGLVPATTAAHGAKAPHLTDWSPLAGRFAAIIGDADADGMGYAAKIAAVLATLDPPACVHIVTLPGLADGEDIEQFVEARRGMGRTDADILAELHALIEAAS